MRIASDVSPPIVDTVPSVVDTNQSFDANVVADSIEFDDVVEIELVRVAIDVELVVIVLIRVDRDVSIVVPSFVMK